MSIHAWLRWATVERLLAQRNVRSVLEIGVGLGSVGVLLARRYDYVGVELDEEAFATAGARFERYGLDRSLLRLGDLSAVADRTFDLVCAFEVLEHYDDDRAQLELWHSLVRPGGFLCVSVPAGPERMGPADAHAGHFRRYARGDLERLLIAARLDDVEVLMYGFPVGYLLEAGRHAYVKHYRADTTGSAEERTRASGRWLQPPGWSAPLLELIATPFQIAQRPFATSSLGTGLVAIARRPA